MRVLEPIAWWQAYAEWYVRPISLEEMVKRLTVLSMRMASAFKAFGITVQQAARAISALAATLPSQKGSR